MTQLQTISKGKQLTPDAISESMMNLIDASVAPNTRKAYALAYQSWEAYRDGRNATDELLAKWITSLHDEGKSPSTIGLKLAGVKFAFRLAGVKIDGEITARVLAGIRRAGSKRGRSSTKGISWDQSDSMSRLASKDDSLKGLRDSALVSVMSDALLRVSEAIGLTVADIEFMPDGSGRLHLVQSKTDQDGRGSVLFLREQTMSYVTAYLNARGAVGDDDVLFVRILKGDRATTNELTVMGIRGIIRQRATNAGLDTAQIRTHSFRVGSACSLAEHGAQLPEMQQAGRWSSPQMPSVYTKKTEAGRGAVARLRS